MNLSSLSLVNAVII